MDKNEDDEAEDEDEEMEKQLAEVKAEEIAELKRYVINTLSFGVLLHYIVKCKNLYALASPYFMHLFLKCK